MVEVEEFEIVNEANNSASGHNSHASNGIVNDSCRYNIEEYTKNISQEILSNTSFIRTKPPHVKRSSKTISREDENRFNSILECINLESLNKEEREIAEQMMKNSLELFHLTGDKLTYTRTIEHVIEIVDTTSVSVR